MSHGRFDAFESAYAGAQTPGASFNANTVDALFVGDIRRDDGGGQGAGQLRQRRLLIDRAVDGHRVRRRLDGRGQVRPPC